LEDLGPLERALGVADIVVSVCPPHGALALAREVAGHGFSGVYIDANAVSPGTVRDIGRVLEAAEATFVDGGIIGPPPVAGARSRRTKGSKRRCSRNGSARSPSLRSGPRSSPCKRARRGAGSARWKKSRRASRRRDCPADSICPPPSSTAGSKASRTAPVHPR